MTKPLKIEHLSSKATDSRESLVSLCASALHMSKGEERLLQFYARQQNGFTPAAKKIMDETGLSKPRVYADRNQLVTHGVAKIMDDVLYIDWERIRLFSTLDPRMTSKHCRIAPVVAKKRDHKVTLGDEFRHRLATCSIAELCELLSTMDDGLYRASIEYLKKLHGIK